jgi:antitoxin (DNA-binding transcriptional repressor) of toxin-antitoxin stability system
MQKTIGLYELKTHVGQIATQLEEGTEFILTRNGKPIGRLTPFETKTKPKRQLGFLQMPPDAGMSLLEPMSEDELRDWYGE